MPFSIFLICTLAKFSVHLHVFTLNDASLTFKMSLKISNKLNQKLVLKYLCLKWCPTHIVLCFCFVFLRLVYPMLPVSLDCPILFAPSVFSNVYYTCTPRNEVVGGYTGFTMSVRLQTNPMSYDNLSCVSQNLLKFYQLFTGEERRIPFIFAIPKLLDLI